MINSVRNTVLSILNKNNYGYISPSDFNLFALQAQMEIFEEYFSSYNKSINMENSHISGTDYADIRKNLEEVMEIFSVTNYLGQYKKNVFYLPSMVTTGDESYLINKVVCYYDKIKVGTNSSIVAFQLVDDTALFLSLNIKEGDIVVNITTGKVSEVSKVVSDTEIILDADIFLATPCDYAIINAYIFSEADKITHSKMTMLRNSNLTSPTNLFPCYSQEKDKISVYPDTIRTKGQIVANYFRTPKAPKWTYISLTNGEPAFDQTQPDYQDFELPNQDEYKLIIKICMYCGITIREVEVAKIAIEEEQREQPSFSNKQ